MKLDSDEQRQLLLHLIGRVQINTNIAELLKGIDPEILKLIQAIQDAEIV